MIHFTSKYSSLWILLVWCATQTALADETARLTTDNFNQIVPAGKEVDAIYGDYFLQNEDLIAIIGDTIPGRHANLTVKNVGGALLDLSSRKNSNDQLSAFFPGAGRYPYFDSKVTGEGADRTLFVMAKADDKGPEVTTSYQLAADPARIVIATEYHNPHQEPITVDLVDAMRADKSFEMAVEPELNLFWVYDDYWDQAYGVVPSEHEVTPDENSVKSRRPFIRYAKEGETSVSVEPGKSYLLKRCLIPGRNMLEILAAANELSGKKLQAVKIQVKDTAGPIHRTRVELSQNGSVYGWALTSEQGELNFSLPAGEYEAKVSALGRPSQNLSIKPSEKTDYTVELMRAGTVVAKIFDEKGKPIPCKVEFAGKEGTETPDFGPDTAEHAVKNLYYSHNGEFRQELGPGKYAVIISHGPEYDAIFTEIEVERGKETELTGKLIHSVETGGWISADFHSHSSPSGDNISSQMGRVLNLLCEHIEFAPCTEHATISSYTPHLQKLGVEHLMATCPGMELTGSPLPLNHQNAFPLLEKPHTQNGGGPETDANPITQIERLAMWDNGSEKLVQQNHPHLYQLLGDKDLDGKPDEGFEKVFGFMDVVEVHPPGLIFAPQQPREDLRATPNRMHAWMQLYNLGYRITGVVNTDAHYNFHGSGPLRNYIRAKDNPATVEILNLVHASEQGQIVMTNGPFLNFELTVDERPLKVAHEIGKEVHAPKGKVHLLITVKCPNWFDVNRVQVFVNGRPEESLNFTRKITPQYFDKDHATFYGRIPAVLAEDAHLIVATAGEGLKLGPVMGPSAGSVMPVAVTNPIFVDVDGKGFQPNGDQLGIPLPIASDHNPSLNHSHPHSHHHHHHHGHSHSHDHDHKHVHPPKKPAKGK